jgi:UDP-N-acetylmuramate dehydrogenase
MIAPDLKDRFRAGLAAAVRFDEPLSRHTSFRIGGPADVWVEVADAAEIRRVQQIAAAADLPIWTLGGGTNILVSDRGIRGVVLHLGRTFADSEWVPNGTRTRVRAGAAGSFKKLVTEAARRELSGLEFAEGIPGTVGGGLLMNAGAFGGEIASVVTGVDGVSSAGAETSLPQEALHFGYRHFDLPPGFIVTFVHFVLLPGDAGEIRARIEHARSRRSGGQPLGLPNAGSIFKNPPGQYAGRLIEEAGLKGRRRGNAMISDRHANFIVNLGGASAADVRFLMEEARQAVRAGSGVTLEPEIKLVGEWQ